MIEDILKELKNEVKKLIEKNQELEIKISNLQDSLYTLTQENMGGDQ